MRWLFGSPMTTIIFVLTVVALAIGSGMIYRGLRGSSTDQAKRKCPRCLQPNPPYARFCAHCGQDLT